MKMAKELTHSESVLTQNVLSPDQLEAGYYLREDDHNIFIYNGDIMRAVCSLHTTSDIIRETVDNLRKGGI